MKLISFDYHFSVLVHIMQIFQRRGLLISEDMIRGYLQKHIQTLWGIQNREDVKRIQKRRVKNEKENQWNHAHLLT